MYLVLRKLFTTAALTACVALPRLALAQTDRDALYGSSAPRESLSARDIDRILLEDSDNGIQEARKTLKFLDRELETTMPRNLARKNNGKMSRNMNRRLRRPEVINWNAPEPKPRKKKKNSD